MWLEGARQRRVTVRRSLWTAGLLSGGISTARLLALFLAVLADACHSRWLCRANLDGAPGSGAAPGSWVIVGLMFDVLVYLYEHYWRPEAFPEAALLSRKLAAVGFEAEEISEALQWLDGLQALTQRDAPTPAPMSTRVYCELELDRLRPEALGFLQFLVSAGVLTPRLREVVMDRVTAVPRGPVALDDFKVLVLLVFWSLGQEPDALILDELFVADEDRVTH